METIGIWTGNPLWTYLVRYDGANGVVYSWTPLKYRMMDWPNPGSVQACDCVPDPTGRFVIQYKSFSPYGDSLQSTGDGGDLLLITPAGSIKIFATQDGGHPGELYYFVGPGETGGWVIAGPDLSPGYAPAWNSCIAMLAQSPGGPNNQQGQLSPAYTRYLRADNVLVPQGTNGVYTGQATPTSCIVSEHYGTADPSGAPEMERFIYGQWIGCVRWEYWSYAPPSAGWFERAGPDFPYGYPSNRPLNPNLQLTDVRTWVNWVSSPDPNFSVYANADWPGSGRLP